MAINIVEKIDHLVPVRRVLMSVSDKSGLDTFVPELMAVNPDIRIFSTGGTFNRIKEILSGLPAEILTLKDFPGFPKVEECASPDAHGTCKTVQHPGMLRSSIGFLRLPAYFGKALA